MSTHESTEIPSFKVLDRNLDIHRNYLLEASAGTGKTFAVENLFVRLLVETDPNKQKPFELQEILAVTFTRAATRDLKTRIRSQIEGAVAILNGATSDPIPDYLFAILECGVETSQKACKNLMQALFCFDQAQIFTIHSFCHRLLRDHLFESGVSLDVKGGDEPLSTAIVLQVVQDFLRTEVNSEIYNSEQFRKLAKTKEDLDDLKINLVKEINKNHVSNSPLSFQEQFTSFCEKMSLLKKLGFSDSEKIYDDFIAQTVCYNKICDRQGNIHPENIDKARRFADLFNRDSWKIEDFELLIKDGLYFCEVFTLSNRKNKAPSPSLHYPTFVEVLKEHLEILVNDAGSKESILKKMAYHCRKHFKNYMMQEELQNFDDLLLEMQRAVNTPSFANKIKQRYRAAIIDEFQDTDPIQWEIFQKLFLSNAPSDPRFLYLVGDPKQAIYSFRNADIYTYIKAAHALGQDHFASLQTNYRSQVHLVRALNILFSSTPDLIPLPQLKTSLAYREVEASEMIPIKNFDDDNGSLQFFAAVVEKKGRKNLLEYAEKTFFFPYIIQEIVHLNQQSIDFCKCAVLVADRHQAERMAEAFKEAGISYINQRQPTLADTPAVTAMRELLTAVIMPRQKSNLKIALGGIILGWPHHKLETLKDHEIMENLLLKFHSYREILYEQGVLSFFHEFMENESITEQLLARKEGEEIYHDLYHLAELLGSHETQKSASPEEIIAYLDDLKYNPQNEDLALKRRGNPDHQGVNIQTIHSSKGLEFDVVFALGLVNRTNSPFESDQSEERDAEKMRLLYVALTRAKYRLYAPALFQDNQKISLGTASPMELLLAKLNQPKVSYEELYERIKTLDKNVIFQFIELCSEIKATDLNQSLFEKSQLGKPNNPILIPPPAYSLPEKQRYIHSYSSLVKAFFPKSMMEEIDPPHNFAALLKTIHTLPSGNVIGNLLHKILEITPFEKGRHHLIEALVSRYVNGTEFEEWKDPINQIIVNAVSTPLPLGLESIPLELMDPCRFYRETEFLYAMQQNPGIEGFEFADGFLKGVIDLMFEFQGKYYILDWKSNWLGPSLEDYTNNHLEAAMQRNNYYFQAGVYVGALKLFLEKVSGEAFSSLFGGVIYIFLRGLHPNVPGNGIYHFFPKGL